jgi:hypothetical protein
MQRAQNPWIRRVPLWSGTMSRSFPRIGNAAAYNSRYL